METVFRLALLCCFTVGMISGEETKGGQPSTEAKAPTTESVDQDTGDQAITDGRYSLYRVKLNWHQAVEMCYQMGQRPAAFYNETEYAQLVKLIRDNFPDDDYKINFWTAGSDLGEMDNYMWISKGRSVLFTKWWRGNPSHSVIKGEMERCIELRSQYNFKMNDVVCSALNYVACERDPCGCN